MQDEGVPLVHLKRVLQSFGGIREGVDLDDVLPEPAAVPLGLSLVEVQDQACIGKGPVLLQYRGEEEKRRAFGRVENTRLPCARAPASDGRGPRLPSRSHWPGRSVPGPTSPPRAPRPRSGCA